MGGRVNFIQNKLFGSIINESNFWVSTTQ